MRRDPSPPASRIAQGEDRRRALLEIAAELFATSGYSGTSTKTIAQQAGVSEALVFHHFGSKSGLLHALSATAPMTPALLLEVLADAGERPLASLPERLARAWEDGDRHGRIFGTLMMDSSHEPEVRSLVDAVVERVQSALAAVFEARQAAGELQAAGAPAAAAALVLSVLVGSRVLASMGPRSTSLEDQLRALIAALTQPPTPTAGR